MALTVWLQQSYSTGSLQLSAPWLGVALSVAGNSETDNLNVIRLPECGWCIGVLLFSGRFPPIPLFSVRDRCPGILVPLQSAGEAGRWQDAWGDGEHLGPLTEPSVSGASCTLDMTTRSTNGRVNGSQ